jgi:putative transposase
MNHKKLRRLYREERLRVRRRGGRKRALGARSSMALPQGSNPRWSLDFLSDAMTDSRRFRILAIVDDFPRECLALVADTSPPGLRVARELDAVIAIRGRDAEPHGKFTPNICYQSPMRLRATCAAKTIVRVYPTRHFFRLVG